LGIGVLVAPALYAVAFVLELLNLLTCGVISCQAVGVWDGARRNAIWTNLCEGCVSGMFPIWYGGFFLYALMFFSIAGAVIGGIYGAAKQIQENNQIKEETEKKEGLAYLKERQRYASEFKNKADGTIRQCESYERESNKINQDLQQLPRYNGAELQEKVWNAIHSASIPLQKLGDIVGEFPNVKQGEE